MSGGEVEQWWSVWNQGLAWGGGGMERVDVGLVVVVRVGNDVEGALVGILGKWG